MKDFVALVVDSLPTEEPVYEFGSLQVPGQEFYADLRPLFPGKEYVGCDIRIGPGVDRVMNLHNIDLADESVGVVLCLETLEHVEFPRVALKEIHRILKPKGVALISSVMNCPIHGHPFDYWRFTPEAFKSLLKSFHNSFVSYAGHGDFPHTIVGIGFKGEPPDLTRFRRLLENWPDRSERFRRKRYEAKISAKRLLKLFVPPIVYHIRRNIS